MNHIKVEMTEKERDREKERQRERESKIARGSGEVRNKQTIGRIGCNKVGRRRREGCRERGREGESEGGRDRWTERE